MNYVHIYNAVYPPSLTSENSTWNLFQLSWNSEKGKFDKRPISILSGRTANGDKIGVSFTRAFEMRGENQVLSYRHPAKSDCHLGLIDLDLCVSNGVISEFARRLLIRLNALAEYSVSGTGIHALCWLTAVPPKSILPIHKDLVRNIEFYWERNTIPLTGKLVSFDGWSSPMDIPDRTQAYLQFHRASFPSAYESSLPVIETGTSELAHEEVLRLLFSEKNGTKWQRVFNGDWQEYYSSPSEADFGLLLKLGFYTNKDRQMMSEIFALSPLSKLLIRANGEQRMLPKWNDERYRETTLDKVLLRVGATFQRRNW